MNILFLLKTLGIGGVEVVTVCLANKFAAEGHRVGIFTFAKTETVSIENRLDNRVKVFVGNGLKCSISNIQILCGALNKMGIDIIINQWGLPFFTLQTAREAAVGRRIRFVTVYHNTPDMNGRLQEIDNRLVNTCHPLKNAFLYTIRYSLKKITAWSMRWNYIHSDCYVLLSPSFIGKFIDYVGVKNIDKLVVQPNPVTIDCLGFKYEFPKKRKEVIFVGRLDNYQKKVNRIIDTWSLLEGKFTDWYLTIVGDGEERESIQGLVQKMNLKRVSFAGFQYPLDYYKRASILILTSEFEGFPLVLPEAMSFGVVPVVYGSYSAVYDILDEGVNGCIVEPIAGKFISSDMAHALASVMENDSIREKMAKKALETSQLYSIDRIYEQWIEIFRKCKCWNERNEQR